MYCITCTFHEVWAIKTKISVDNSLTREICLGCLSLYF